LKRILVLSLSVLFCLSFAGCAKGGSNSSADSSSFVSILSEETSGSDFSPSSGVSSSSPAVSETNPQTTSEYKELVSQLDDLEKALNELDQISDTDVEIPAP